MIHVNLLLKSPVPLISVIKSSNSFILRPPSLRTKESIHKYFSTNYHVFLSNKLRNFAKLVSFLHTTRKYTQFFCKESLVKKVYKISASGLSYFVQIVSLKFSLKNSRSEPHYLQKLPEAKVSYKYFIDSFNVLGFSASVFF